MRTLYVVKTSIKELSDKWHCSYGVVKNTFSGEQVYIQANMVGVVNWDKNSVYKSSELIERNNVRVVELNDKD